MRIFIGIELPKDLKEKIYFFSQEIGREYKIRLVEKENLHLTMLFLGNIEEGAVRKIREMGEIRGIREIGKIGLRLGKPEFFPRKRPRGIWINVEGEIEKLKCLHKKIIDLLLAKGFSLKESCLRFSPHITIGRFKKTGRDLKGLNLFQDCVDKVQPFSDFLANKVTLYQSKLTSKGPVYSKIGEFEVK